MAVGPDIHREALERYERAAMALWDNLRAWLNAREDLQEIEDDRPKAGNPRER